MNTLKTLLFIGVMIQVSCNGKRPESDKESVSEPAIVEDSSYTHKDGTICHAQSPINILSFNTDKEGRHNITFNFKDEINAVENLGHTVQLDFETGSTITVDDETFDFKQLHFHTPSEHLLDGITYPMEMHIVNTLAGQDENAETEFLVIGILFKMGKTNNFINEFINLIPKKEHGVTSVDLGTIKIADLLKKEPEHLLDHYYQYKGSLTTAPFSETVRWYVSKTIFEASPEQIKTILNSEGLNARHIQGVNNRKINTK